MMPVLRISDATFESLRVLEKWWDTKTPAKTLEHAVSQAMLDLGIEPDNELDIADEQISVSHTRVLSSKVSGRMLLKNNWGAVLLAVISSVRKELSDDQKLSAIIKINSQEGEKTDSGYKYYPKLGISIQGQSAPDAWKEASRLAREWKIGVEVEFEWLDKPEAQKPGQRHVFQIR